MKLKKLAALTLSASFMAGSVSAFGDDLTVMYNSRPIEFQYAQPLIVSGRTLVPLRGIFDTMGYEITYDAETKTAILSNGVSVIKASSEEMSITQNGATTVLDSDVKPQLIDNYFMVPLRAVATATGAEVDWDGDTRTVSIYADSPVTEVTENIEGTMKVEEKEYLAKVQETTTEIKSYARQNNDELLYNALGMSESESISPSGDYGEVLEKLNELKALEPPAAMFRVQTLVDEYVDELMSLINDSKTLSEEELAARALETSMALSTASENFGVELWNYFTANEVNFEKVYGEAILDALK